MSAIRKCVADVQCEFLIAGQAGNNLDRRAIIGADCYRVQLKGVPIYHFSDKSLISFDDECADWDLQHSRVLHSHFRMHGAACNDLVLLFVASASANNIRD